MNRISKEIIVEKQDKIQWLFSSRNNKELVERYTQWAEDYEFALKLISVTKVCAVKEYLALYRMTPDSLSGYSKSFVPAFLEELGLWLEFEDWLHAQITALDYDKHHISTMIHTVVVPALAIHNLFKSLLFDYDISQYIDV